MQIEDGPAAVTGDKFRKKPLSQTKMGRCGCERSGSQKTCLNKSGMASWTECIPMILDMKGDPGSMCIIGPGFFIFPDQSMEGETTWEKE